MINYWNKFGDKERYLKIGDKSIIVPLYKRGHRIDRKI